MNALNNLIFSEDLRVQLEMMCCWEQRMSNVLHSRTAIIEQAISQSLQIPITRIIPKPLLDNP